jgi:hypothetical protein
MRGVPFWVATPWLELHGGWVPWVPLRFTHGYSWGGAMRLSRGVDLGLGWGFVELNACSCGGGGGAEAAGEFLPEFGFFGGG